MCLGERTLEAKRDQLVASSAQRRDAKKRARVHDHSGRSRAQRPPRPGSILHRDQGSHLPAKREVLGLSEA